MMQRVIIIGHSFTSRLGLIRSVGSIGCRVTIIAMVGTDKDGKLKTARPIDSYSKYVDNVFFCHLRDEERLVSILLNGCSDNENPAIIIPDTDFSAMVVDKHREDLKDSFLFPYIAFGDSTVEYWMDKDHQKTLARSIGMNVAGSVTVSVEDHKFIIPDSVNYPCFTKPLVSVNGGKRFLRKCNNAQELACVLTEAAKPRDVKVLIEDYKHIDEEYAILGFSDGKEVIVPGVVKIDKMSLSHPGIGTEGVIMPVRGFEELIDKFKEFVRTIGFMGLFDIDFYRSGETYYFGEMNLRFGGSGYSVTKMGVNLPAMMVKFLTEQPYDNMKKDVADTARFVNERICLDDWYQGFISTKEYKAMTTEPRISFIRDVDDPAPSKAYDSEFRSKFIRRFIKQMIKK